jgi:GT2 family glycosyltransferase
MIARPCVTVVVVTYQSSTEIQECLQSLYETSGEWVSDCRVVDNHSTDNTAEIVTRSFPQATVIRNEENLGFSRAVNQGARDSDTDYLLVLNPDARLTSGSLGELVCFLEHRKAAGACGPMITSPSGEFQSSCRRGFPTPLNALGYYLHLDRLMPKSRIWTGYRSCGASPVDEIRTDVLSGSCFLIRTPVFHEIGGFDEDYFLFGEDIDICCKLRAAGKEVWYVPAARVVHHKGASMAQAAGLAKREFHRAMLIYINKRLSGDYSRFSRTVMKIGVHVHRLLGMLPGF